MESRCGAARQEARGEEGRGLLRAGLVDRFELRVKELNPQLPQITYEMTDMYNWMDQMVRRTCCTALLSGLDL